MPDYQNRRQVSLRGTGPVRLQDIPSVPVTIILKNRGSVPLTFRVKEADALKADEKFSNEGNLNQLPGFDTKDLENDLGVADPSGDTPATLESVNAGPFNLDAGDTVIIDVDAGGDATAAFDAAAPSVTGSNTETFDFSSDRDLTLVVNGVEETITLETTDFGTPGAGTAAEARDAINAKTSLPITATAPGTAVILTHDKLGTGQTLEVKDAGASQAEDILGLAVGIETGTGDVSDIEAVTGAEIKAVVEADISGTLVTPLPSGQVRIQSTTLGASSSLKVNAASTGVGATKIDLPLDLVTGADDVTPSQFVNVALPTSVVNGGESQVVITNRKRFLEISWEDGAGDAADADAQALLSWLGHGGNDRIQLAKLSDDPAVRPQPIY